ncbi:hypothetical protein SmJEL517_g02408 [Synchytrium microbalum]|uniref:Prenylcysteine lyase domain-containing protein n=1 Tax=Synchytrium microbalum TaxID=1806994 RepID=A0A507C7C7_9FUNG|nr:uncharacterized protein SmJEL517_g02408 [Synchytrium microbalum]TPX35039.1 hypothetical protein SmJEL517_g02408 [Synchytrium microbalum]
MVFKTRKIAIIGSGPAGSYASFSLREQFPDSNITIYERNSVVGGRVHSIPILDPTAPADSPPIIVESGASIFLKTNKHLHDACIKYKLEFTTQDDIDDGLVVWNGNEILYTMKSNWDYVKGVWRWGTSPLRTYRAANEAASKWYKTYDKNDVGFETWQEFLDHYSLLDYMSVSAREFLAKNWGVSEKFIDEVVEPITRVNYAQNSDMNSLGALVVLTALFGDVQQVKGGNSQIMAKWIEESKATVKLNTRVTGVRRLAPGGADGVVVETLRGKPEVFDIVIIACPGGQSNIDLGPNIPTLPMIPYVKLYVTFVTGQVDPTAFGLPPTSKAPSTILTSNNATLPFLSISIVAYCHDKNTTITKIFSRTYMTATELQKYYKEIKAVTRREWWSYPELPPTSSGAFGDSVEVARNVFYVNGFEGAFSTMESETVAALNIIKIIKGRAGESGRKRRVVAKL